MSQSIPSQLYEAIKMKDRNDKTLQLRVVQEIKKGNLENLNIHIQISTSHLQITIKKAVVKSEKGQSRKLKYSYIIKYKSHDEGKNKYYSSPGQQTSLEDESPLYMTKQTSIRNYIFYRKRL